MKKYIILGNWISTTPVGMQRFAYQLLVELDKILGNANFKVELLIPIDKEWKNPFKNISVVRKGKNTSKIRTKIWEQLVFPMYVFKNKGIGIDLTTKLPVLGCSIYAIHDCIPTMFPQNFKHHKYFLYSTRLKLRLITMKKRVHIVTVSENSSSDIQKLYNVLPEKITVIYNGWEHMERIQSDLSVFERFGNIVPNNYYFSLGSKYWHKNYKWIINTAKRNPDEYFVISGADNFSKEWLEESQITEILANVGLTGYLSDGEIKALMSQCKALILPSYYEGFGIPPLEALSLGKNIIISNTSCLPEIYKRSAYYIDPYSDGVDLKDVMKQDVSDARATLEKYTWKNAGKAFFELLNKE